MTASRLKGAHAMPSAELTSTQAPKEPAADPSAPRPRSLPTVTSGLPASFGRLAHPQAARREATGKPSDGRSRCPAAFHAIALWLLRALTDSAGAWALAAGAPPDLDHPADDTLRPL
jgi:hypothetical protein